MQRRLTGCFSLLIVAAVAFALPARLEAQAIPTPESVLGHKPGDDFYLATYDESLDYFRKLDAATDRLQLVQVGQTTGGLDWYLAVISSAENLRNLDRHKDIARRIALARGLDDEQARALSRDGRAIVHIDGGLHSTEVAHGQHTIQLAYDLVAGYDADPRTKAILDNVILVLWFSINPDGQNMVADWYRRNLGTPFEVAPMPWLYQRYVGHDNNRDGYMLNMHESRVVTHQTVNEWFPMVFYNHHQTAPFPARIWIPPFAEPVSTNMSPLMWRWTSLFGTAMAAYLDERGMPGSIHRGGFDDWYPGFIDNVNNYRNTISFLTETALYRYATPHFYTVGDFPENYRDLRKQVFYSSPWEGGWWRLGDAVRYMIGASMSVLDTAARYKEEIIFNRYQAGRDTIARFASSPPFAYVVPEAQRDPQTAALMLDRLRLNGIEISRASAAFTAGGRAFPAGTWVILMDQPFALLAKELFDVQAYPDLGKTPDGALDLPYDVVGWTLPIQMGVEVVPVTEPLAPDFREKMTRIDEVTPPAGVTGSGSTFVLDRHVNASYRAVNRILAEGGSVAVAGSAMTVDGRSFGPGAFVVTGLARDRMQAVAAELGIEARAAARVTETTAALKAARVAVYQPWQANMDAGWTEWLLEDFGFPITNIRNDAIRAGQLEARFDAIVIAEMGTRTIMDGYSVGTLPGEFVGGIGEDGLANLNAFVKAGGTLVVLGNASAFAIEKFHLPVKNVVEGLKNEEFFCGGSLLKTTLKAPGHPLTFGLADEPAAFFARSGAFETERGFEGTVLLEYPKEGTLLQSGFILNPEKIQGKAASLEVRHGKGRIVITGFRPQWRGQPHNTFKLLFNALYVGGGEAPAAAVGQAATRNLGGDWAAVTAAVAKDLEAIFAQNQEYAGARGSQSVEEGKKFDDLVAKFQAARIKQIDDFARQAGTRAPGQKIDEYKAQLKAALVDMRGKDYAATNFTLGDLRIQFRLAVLEREIGDAVGGRS